MFMQWRHGKQSLFLTKHVGARVGARGNEPLYFVSWSIVSEGIVFVVLKLC